MFGWFRKKPPKQPMPAFTNVAPPVGPISDDNAKPAVIVRAVGAAVTRKRRQGEITVADVMSAAVLQAAEDGFSTSDARVVSEYMQKARADFKQAIGSATATRQPVTLHIGKREFTVHPRD